MAIARYLLPLPVGTRPEFPIRPSTCSAVGSPIPSPSSTASSASVPVSWRHILLRSSPLLASKAYASHRASHKAKAEQTESGGGIALDTYTNFKHVLLPITDQNAFLSEGTRQAAATTAALAKKNGADITVVVIDDKSKESIPDHDARLSSIRWHLSEGGFQEFGLIERLGEGKKPTAIIGEVADEMNLDLVVLSMEAIHSNHVDGNLLAEFIPCPVLLLPL